MDIYGSFSHDRYQDLCQNLGGKLPEPRNEKENKFLETLTTHPLEKLDTSNFVLGINDKEVEGQWVFDSDNSQVTWFDWAENGGIPKDRTPYNCVFMNLDWRDYKCESSPIFDAQRKHLVCERFSTQGNRSPLSVVRGCSNMISQGGGVNKVE